MIVIEFSTAIGCPISCAACPQTKIEAAYRGPRLLTVDIFRHCLDHIPSGVPLIFAGFAEPFLNRHTIDMIELAAPDHDFIHVYTTAVGMSDRDVMGLRKFQPKIITLHLADAEGYAKIRVDDAYVDRMAELAGLPGVNWMTMGTIHPKLVPIFGNVKPGVMNSRAGNVEGMVQISKSGPLKCKVAPELDHPVVLPDASCVLCCSDWSMEHVIGNLAEQTWAEIHAGAALMGIRERMNDGACLCRHCEYAVPA